jgi:hypothetical protein
MPPTIIVVTSPCTRRTTAPTGKSRSSDCTLVGWWALVVRTCDLSLNNETTWAAIASLASFATELARPGGDAGAARFAIMRTRKAQEPGMEAEPSSRSK